jgi:hypothetical protein
MDFTILSHIGDYFKFFAFSGSKQSYFTFFWYIYCNKMLVTKDAEIKLYKDFTDVIQNGTLRVTFN